MSFNVVPPDPCCVPSRKRAFELDQSRRLSAERVRVANGSTDGMIRLDGGPFLMGNESAEGFQADGEGPVRQVHVDPFYMDARPVRRQGIRCTTCT